MPYEWIAPTAAKNARRELHLWPYQSLRPNGFVLFFGVTFALAMIPMIALLGTFALWGTLPFFIVTIGALWVALGRSRAKAQVLEVLTLTDDQARLVRHDPHGSVRQWECNRYWTRAHLHTEGGPVPNYVTLRGGGREVEIGAFLSEPERVQLFSELQSALSAEAGAERV